ncbi:hypothetical protein QVD17_08488 [Tagetes erecta]|uniref:Uncharacterized protein n=1 Tax=Tagetes erecta TaxID=13708 RepID=A0AAD8P4M3_TARER|nr:hypothetical protein QVD17_08488 [Tagetes erecta]
MEGMKNKPNSIDCDCVVDLQGWWVCVLRIHLVMVVNRVYCRGGVWMASVEICARCSSIRVVAVVIWAFLWSDYFCIQWLRLVLFNYAFGTILKVKELHMAATRVSKIAPSKSSKPLEGRVITKRKPYTPDEQNKTRTMVLL